jgi:hypothetical protein
MDGLIAPFSSFLSAPSLGWGTLVLVVIGYFFVTRILKLILFCVFLVAIATGYYFLVHKSDAKPAENTAVNSIKTVIEQKHQGRTPCQSVPT